MAQVLEDFESDLLLAALGIAGDDLRELDLTPGRPLTGRATATMPRRAKARGARAAQLWGGDAYRASLARYPLLSAADEQRLAREIEAGVFAEEVLQTTRCGGTDEVDLQHIAHNGRQAFQQVLVSNLRLVYYWAVRHQGRGLELDDLAQEGTLGLCRAAQKFDYATGYKFSTYATWWIKQSMTRAISDYGRTVRLPVHVDERVVRVQRRYAMALEVDTLNPVDAVARELDIDASEVRQLLLWGRRTWSLDELIDADLLDERDEDHGQEPYEDEDCRRAVREALLLLPERDRHIMIRRYGLEDGIERTLDVVGKEFGLTRERIRQIENRVKERLRVDPSIVGLLD